MPWPYARVFNRVVLVVLVGLIFWRRDDFQVAKVISIIDPRGRWRYFFSGIALSVLISAALLPWFIFSGDLSWSIRDAEHYLTRVPKVLLGAIITAFIEEFIFRGIILTELKSRIKLSWAIIITTLIYASVHFIAPQKGWVFTGSLLAGFDYLSALFAGMAHPQHLFPFIGLCCVGVVLSLAYLRTGSLVLAVGLHAGWILAVKSVFHLTALNPTLQADLVPLATRYFLVSHPVGWLAVILVGLLVVILFKNQK